MTTQTAMVLVVFCKSLVGIAAVLGATWLAFNGKDGWGWLIFAAVVLSSGSVKLD